jgi:hypothetical protein
MPIRNRDEDELLGYACYKIISKYKNEKTGKVDSLRFNKMISLLDHRLKDESNLDLKVPICWYFFGEEVVPVEMPQGVKFEPRERRIDEYSHFWWEGERPKPDGRKKARVDACIDSLYSHYPPSEDVYGAVDADYQYAPFEFQRKYKEFRSDSLIRSEVDPDGKFRSQALYAPGIRLAFAQFPFMEFPQLKVMATQVEIILTAIFTQRPSENKRAVKIAKRFWETFCKFLRIYDDDKRKGYRNVTSARVGHWKKDAQDVLVQYRLDLDAEIKTIIRLLPDDAIEDPMDRMFLDPMEFEPQDDIDQTIYR